ncbi:hypothetical protein DFH06DRAFT_1093749 [Mycena polygramma]|nr:hypothetical protein DFH06DRAFT_1093749 [Mycena polygramma]
MDIPVSNHNGPAGFELRLPPELECLIFEIAALSRPSSIPVLMRIARRVKYWQVVEPILYRVVFLAPRSATKDSLQRHLEDLPLFSANALLHKIEMKSPSFFASAVRHIFFQFRVTPLPPSTVDTILSACCRISSLFMHARASSELLPVLNRLECLQRLAMDLNSIFAPNSISFTEPFFRNVTHLELLDSYDDSDPPANLDASLALLPHLTHVAFNPATYTVAAELYTLVRPNTRLQCLVFFTEKDAKPDAEDDRFVCIDQTDFRLDWIRGTTGGEDHWALAEQFIAAKRAGRVPRSLYWILDTDTSWRT